ncbi:hypothetical protein R1sor_005144 [Riccia sorocarpa]|uniref:Uncharacterized protein n=1 Tax=Riccia sorocarpa TaxID=122646 RepID=A0ABD3HJ80_9MARC
MPVAMAGTGDRKGTGRKTINPAAAVDKLVVQRASHGMDYRNVGLEKMHGNWTVESANVKTPLSSRTSDRYRLRRSRVALHKIVQGITFHSFSKSGVPCEVNWDMASHCGCAVRHWSCNREGCEVLIWSKARQSYVCVECSLSECKVAYDTSDTSMLALSLSLELYYRSQRRLISEEGDKLLELWKKAKVSDTEFARTAAKEAAAAACRAAETAECLWYSSARAEAAARTMMAELARNQARARARVSVPVTLSEASPNSGLTHHLLSRVPSVTPSSGSGQTPNMSPSSSDDDASMQQQVSYQSLSGNNRKRIRRRSVTVRKLVSQCLCSSSSL